MNLKIQILLALTAAATSSFLQTPSNQLESTFNSTFLTPNEQLFQPIIIPNITKFPENSQKRKANEKIFKNIVHHEDSSQESVIDDKSEINEIPLKFSSRYSTKQNDLMISQEKITENENGIGTTEFPDSAKKIETQSVKNEEIYKLFSDRSDNTDSEENKTNTDYYSEEESEVEPTSESPSPTTYRKYLDEDSENYEKSATGGTDSFEETKEETEDKRSVEDYHDSGSKNYHSIQTPLNRIIYQGPHSFNDYELENDRKRIVSPMVRRPPTHNWPYSKSQIKKELENLNEIPESNESYEKELQDEGISDRVRTNSKQLGLESAEEKDKRKFDRNKKYNYIELRNRKKQQQKALIAEEEKDNQKPLIQSLKQYQVDEKELTHQPKAKPIFNLKINDKIWSTKRPPVTPKGNFRLNKLQKIPIIDTASDKHTLNFQGHQFLGPVVFNQNSDLQKSKPYEKPQKEATHNIFLKGLIENEKLDQDNLINQRLQNGSKDTQSFNHLKESDEMYTAILANIQSVFGLRTQPLKSGARSQKGSLREVDLDESKALTWSLPLVKDD